ncbi:hypothetical protein [Actinocorallia populi]|uniref:hypothetical protein n=1 Tax=Actinocorallia populi TaxID=2079200 RepID=UPI000D08C0BE|nr:hypothetical protein [Actinocorallia populi]
MARRWILAALLAVAAGGAAAGCSSGEEKAAADETPLLGPEAAWATKVCTTVAGQGLQLKMPALDTSQGAQAKQGIVDFLTQVSGQMQKMDEGLRAAGPPPVDGGREKTDKALTRLDGARKAVDKAATTLRRAKVTDEKSLQTALGSVARVMVKYGEYQGPLQDLKAADPKLNIAFLAAPSCRGLG